MTEEKKPVKKTVKKHVALKNLCTSKGMVKKGSEFTCTSKELEVFKANGAV
jgi:hypothetical protein